MLYLAYILLDPPTVTQLFESDIIPTEEEEKHFARQSIVCYVIGRKMTLCAKSYETREAFIAGLNIGYDSKCLPTLSTNN